MRRRLSIWLIPLGLAVPAACSNASPAATTAPATTGTTTSPAPGIPPQGGHRTAVQVRPSSGGPSTAFVVTFKAPQAAGAAGIRATRYAITATGPQATGCQASAAEAIRRARKGARLRVRLASQTEGWCRGAFRGTVELISGPNCVRGQVCPEFVSVVSTVGRFTFHVK